MATGVSEKQQAALAESGRRQVSLLGTENRGG